MRFHEILRASEVSAEILASSVETYSVGSGTSRESRWRPVVRYRVNERTYESIRVTHLNKGDDRPWAEEIAARFHAGDTVTAWFDPEDVEHSFLLPIGSWKEPAGFGLGVAMVLVTGFVLLRRRAAAPQESQGSTSS